MNADELKELIVKNGFHPIPVQGLGGISNRLPRFAGTADEFWTAAKALSAKAVFLEVSQMDESDFEHSPPNESSYDGSDDEDDDDGEDPVNLEEMHPPLSKYRKHIGKDCVFVLVATGGCAEIELVLSEPWWEEFREELEKATQALETRRAVLVEEEEAETAKRNDALIGQLKSLISDREFCVLKTQRAMLAYAIEKFPDLESLGDFVLKQEIQALHARIEARGLNRK